MASVRKGTGDTIIETVSVLSTDYNIFCVIVFFMSVTAGKPVSLCHFVSHTFPYGMSVF